MAALNRSLRPLRTIPGLAAANLRHEWILTLCLVVALAAVIAPLLVLLGLRHGTIETLRGRLVEDPVYREIRPTQTLALDQQWFERVGAWPEVGFLTPTILPLSSVIHVAHPESGNLELFDLLPTASGDPLLLENGAPIPEDGQCVLTAEAARRLGVEHGDWLEVRVTRARAGRSEMAQDSLYVAGVLDLRAGSLPRVYAPLSFVQDVEAYKEGYGSPARGWSGDRPEPFLSFDGVLIYLSKAMDPISRSGLVINTGFARADPVTAEQAVILTGVPLPEEWKALNVHAPGAVVTPSSISALARKLRGWDNILLPYVRDVALEMETLGVVTPLGISLDPLQAARVGLPALPWGAFTGSAEDGERLLQALIPAEVDPTAIMEVRGQWLTDLEFPLLPAGGSPMDALVVPSELLGILRTAQQRTVHYQPETKAFVMARGGFRGFRLATHGIDDVPAVHRRLQNEGIETITQVETIERIRVLDTGLGRLFWLIATLSIGGGTAVLLSSLYAAVERLKRDLGMLRLVGFSRRHVFVFPLIQAKIIAVLGLMVGMGASFALATVINQTFARELGPEEQFCRLPESYLLAVTLTTMGLALVSALVAAWRTTHIDPAEAIREN